MGDQDFTLYDARQALSSALKTGEDPPAWALQTMVEHTAGAALRDFVKTFVEDHTTTYWDDEISVAEVDSEAVTELLAGLDSLRAPLPSEVLKAEENARKTAIHDAATRIRGMLRLSWTGDHLYSDAVEDALTMLTSVAEGKPVPKLERFRCPSLLEVFGTPDYFVRCELQLPHASNHVAQDAAWTDEQSVNPPIPYDSDAKELSGHPVRKVDRLEAEVPPDARCDQWRLAVEKRWLCEKELGHEGFHRVDGYGKWI